MNTAEIELFIRVYLYSKMIWALFMAHVFINRPGKDQAYAGGWRGLMRYNAVHLIQGMWVVVMGSLYIYSPYKNSFYWLIIPWLIDAFVFLDTLQPLMISIVQLFELIVAFATPRMWKQLTLQKIVSPIVVVESATVTVWFTVLLWRFIFG